MATETEVEVAVSEEQQEREESGSVTESTTRKRRNIFKRRNSEEHSRRPPSNKWLQQQIPACRPVFTAIHAFVGFLIIGIAFLILGSVFTAFSSQLREFEVSYEGCSPIVTDDADVRTNGTCEEYLAAVSTMPNTERFGIPECHCKVNFTLPESFRPPWNFYYGMRNYYQNHRRYLNSWDVNQLRGSEGSFRGPTSDCRPFVNLDNPNGDDPEQLPVVPCGLIANSWFNDSFDEFVSADGSVEVSLDRTNIAWPTDRSVRFQNPGGAEELDPGTLTGTIMPPNWLQNLSIVPGGLQNESLMVWFRVSAFPWFRKLYGRPAVNNRTDMELPSGNYTILLTYNYPVSNFNGRKSIILAEVNWLGGRNLFLGIAYLVVGVFLVIMAFGLLLLHKLCSKWKLSRAPFDNN